MVVGVTSHFGKIYGVHIFNRSLGICLTKSVVSGPTAEVVVDQDSSLSDRCRS